METPGSSSDSPDVLMDSPTFPVAVVTGASRGLGAGIAQFLADHGFRLGLCARNRPDPPSGQGHHLCVSADVRDHAGLAAFADDVGDELGPINLWINNAGVLDPIGPLRDAPVDQLRTHVEINLLGTMWGSRIFAALVHDRAEPGTLINITSGAARSVYEGWAAYCATKAGVDQLTRVVAAEEADAGLAAYAVSPGVVDTDMQALIRATPAERFAQVERFIGLAETGSFNSPAWVAEHLLDLHLASNSQELPPWADTSADPVVLRLPAQPHT